MLWSSYKYNGKTIRKITSDRARRKIKMFIYKAIMSIKLKTKKKSIRLPMMLYKKMKKLNKRYQKNQ